MANIGFVSTSVLESKDGIAFNEERRKETEETREADKIAKQAELKPLWQQLAANRDEKQAQFDAVRAAIFAPPKALDDEEAEYLANVEEQRAQAREKKSDWENKELLAFTLARANQTVALREPQKEKSRPSSAGAGSGSGPGAAATAGSGPESGQDSSGAPTPVTSITIKPKRKHSKDKDKEKKKPRKRSGSTMAESEGKAGGQERRDGAEESGTQGLESALAAEGAGARAGVGAAAAAAVAAAAAGVREGVGTGGQGEGGQPESRPHNKDAEDEGRGGGLSSLLGAYDSDDSEQGGSM